MEDALDKKKALRPSRSRKFELKLEVKEKE